MNIVWESFIGIEICKYNSHQDVVEGNVPRGDVFNHFLLRSEAIAWDIAKNEEILFSIEIVFSYKE